MKSLILAFVFLLGPKVFAQGPAPTGPFNVRDFGAIGDGVTDDSVAIASALTAIKSQPEPAMLIFPEGTYLYSRNIKVDGVTVVGAGSAKTILESTNLEQSAWILTGNSPEIRDVAIRTSCVVNYRNTKPAATGIQVREASGFTITGVAVGPTASAGIIVYRSGGTPDKHAIIRDCLVSQTKADGIHVTAASHDLDIIRNRVTGTGDDLIAVVSYRSDRSECHGIVIAHNTVGTQTLGRGISVVGGTDVIIDSNEVNTTCGAGIYMASETGYDTSEVNDVSIQSNTLTNTASDAALGHGAIHLVGRANPVSGEAPLEIKNITIKGNHIAVASRSGLYIGPYSSGVAIIGNDIAGVKGSAISIGPLVTDIAVGSTASGTVQNIVKSCGEYGVQVNPSDSKGVLQIIGVLFQSLNTRGLSYVDVINIAKNGTFASITITDNRLEQPEGMNIERFVEASSPLTEVARNTANVPIGNAYSINQSPEKPSNARIKILNIPKTN